jgi:hypothetical protein
MNQTTLKNLYEQDFSAWIQRHIESWRCSIIEQRIQIVRLVNNNLSLKPYLREALAEAYPFAVKQASKETNLPKTAFPTICPYTFEQLLDEDYYPN